MSSVSSNWLVTAAEYEFDDTDCHQLAHL